MLVTGLEILRKARAEGYGVGAFNTNNMEFTQAILEAAEEMKSPVILALSEGAMKYGAGPSPAWWWPWPRRPGCPWPCTWTTAPATRASSRPSGRASPAS